MDNMPLRLKMILGWMVLVVVPLAIIGTAFFVFATAALESMAKSRTERVAENLAAMVKAELLGELKTISSIAADPQISEAVSSGRFNGPAELKLMRIHERIGSQYEGIFVTDRNGVIRIDSTDRKRLGIRIGHRAYFHRAEQGISSIGDPIFSQATGKPILVACAPVFDRNRAFRGVAAITLKIDLLSNRVSSVRIGNKGYSFMIGGDGIAIAHPFSPDILRDNVARLAGAEKLAERMIRQETGTERYSLKGIVKVASFAPVGINGWSVGVTQDHSEFMEPINAIRKFYLLAGIVFLLITTAGIFYFSRNISTPIQKTLSTLNKAIEQSEEMFAILGTDRKVQFVNPAMERITGRPAAELIGNEPFPTGAANSAPEEMRQALHQGNAWSGRIAGIGRSGLPYKLEATITPVRDEKGAVISYLLMGRDITREQMLESQLRQGQKMEAIGTLAGGIAHDFNNILSAIFGYAELALLPHEDRSKTSQYIQGILTAAGRARDLVGQILTFSRRTEQETRPLEPKYLIKETLKLLRASLPATIEIRDEIRSNSLILGDPTQLHQVVMNLCTNAAHAMRESGGVLSIGLEDVAVDERFAGLHPGMAPGPHLRLKVSDTGEGMPPGIRERIFDPFFTTKPKGEGTGLGLSVVHGIVKSFGGFIAVRSEPGKGSEFDVYFPAIGTAAAETGKSDDRALPRGNERILLIDDEPNITAVGKEMLEKLGYRVEAFNESAPALERFRNAPDAFDVVITDYNMPHLSGLDVIRLLKTVRSDVPILLCSGYFDVNLERHAGEFGRIERLNKPFTAQDLAFAVRRAVEARAVKT
jgi:PAS domain S-box-containing protein